MKRGKQRDTLFAGPLQSIVDFSFDEAVAGVFPDMIQRSVPGYSTLISLSGLLTAEFARPNSHCYDLGCSVGATTLSMRRRLRQPGCILFAVDNSEAMIARARVNLAGDDSPVTVELCCRDILEMPIENASVVALNYTLQFVPPTRREELIRRIHAGMQPGGALLLSEKIAFPCARQERRFSELHYAFKRDNGYSDLEISRKRSALENVLVPETLDSHRARLQQAGFTSVDIWFQCLNFISLLAVK